MVAWAKYLTAEQAESIRAHTVDEARKLQREIAMRKPEGARSAV